MLTKTTLCLLVLALAAAVQASSIPPHETYGDEDHHEDDHHEDDHHEDDHHEGDHHEDDHKDDHHDSSSSSSSSSSEEEEEDDHHDEHSQDHEASHEDLHDRLHDLDHEMDRLTSRLQHLHDDFDHKVEERSEQTARAVNIKLRMAKKDHVCTEGYFRCTSTEDQCISDILVCDGVKDCHDGSDESEHVCTFPYGVGDRWMYRPIYDHCASTAPEFAFDEVISLERDPHWPSSIQIKVHGNFFYKDDRGLHKVVVPYNGMYQYGKHEITWLVNQNDPWEGVEWKNHLYMEDGEVMFDIYAYHAGELCGHYVKIDELHLDDYEDLQ